MSEFDCLCDEAPYEVGYPLIFEGVNGYFTDDLEEGGSGE